MEWDEMLAAARFDLDRMRRDGAAGLWERSHAVRWAWDRLYWALANQMPPVLARRFVPEEVPGWFDVTAQEAIDDELTFTLSAEAGRGVIECKVAGTEGPVWTLQRSKAGATGALAYLFFARVGSKVIAASNNPCVLAAILTEGAESTAIPESSTPPLRRDPNEPLTPSERELRDSFRVWHTAPADYAQFKCLRKALESFARSVAEEAIIDHVKSGCLAEPHEDEGDDIAF